MLTPRSFASVLLLASSVLLQSSAATLDIRAPARQYPVSVSRGPDSTGFGFTNVNDNLYSATIVVNGVQYQVQLDTGSSDTWIDPWSVGAADPPNLIHTGYNASTSYIGGDSGSGPIVLADVSFGPYTIKNQAITLGYGNADGSSMNGLLGLGGSSRSEIYATLMNTSYADNSRAMLYNIFAHEPDRPDYITWLMSRTDLGDTDGGVLTISEVLANMTDILDAPRLDSLFPGQWTSWLDGIYVNGRFVGGHSNITDLYKEHGIDAPSDTSTSASFDSGSSLILAPEYYVHEIYKDVPGSYPTRLGPPLNQLVYAIPCDTKIQIRWLFAGRIYPMHPIDVVTIASITSENITCMGSIQGADGHDAGFGDWLLGDAFLRNVYHLYGYGNASAVDAYPYIKLLSVVDEAKAWNEADSMIQARLEAFESAISATYSSIPATIRPSYTGLVKSASLTYIPESTAHASTSADARLAAAGALAESKAESDGGSVDLSGLERNTYIIMGLLGAVIVLLLAVVAVSLKAARANRRYEPLVGGAPPGAKGLYSADRPYDG